MLIEKAIQSDMPLILHAWANGMRVTPLYEWMPRSVFFGYFLGPKNTTTGERADGALERLAAESTVLVARPSDVVGADGTKDIAGFICGRRDDSAPLAGPCPVIVHWIFVKATYRVPGFNVAKRLLHALGWEKGYPIGATGWSDVCETAVPGTLLFVPSLLNSKPAKKAA